MFSIVHFFPTACPKLFDDAQFSLAPRGGGHHRCGSSPCQQVAMALLANQMPHERILQQKTAKYPITRVECKVIHLPQGKKSFTHYNLFLGQHPKRIVLGLVDNRAFNGDISLNPYKFQHCNLHYLVVHLAGQQVPWAPL